MSIHPASCIRLLALALAALAAPAQDAPDPGAPVPAPERAPAEVFDLWPGTPPEPNNAEVGEEIMLVERRRPFYQITNVTKPTVSVYLPEKSKANGGAVMVYPGGGLVRLAIEHEGYEIADWLNELGLAAFLVKYRVPPGGEGFRERYKPATQDAQRAISLVRSRAAEWNIDPDGIGAIGFSAGGEVGTWLSVLDDRLYDAVDAADKQPLRPAFMLNIYPGGLAFGRRGEEPRVRQDLVERVNEKTPPMFFAHAFPDASMNSILMTKLLKEKNIPAELHIFQEGAHGFGARTGGAPLAIWKQLAANWMGALGFLDSMGVREVSKGAIQSKASGGKLPRLTALDSKATLEDGYRAQRRVTDAVEEKVIGYKGAAATVAAQKQLELSGPFDCVLFESTRLERGKPVAHASGAVFEAELGYILGVDIPTRIENADEARTATQAIVPVVELPVSFDAQFDGPPKPADIVAVNCGAPTRILLGDEFHPDRIDPDTIPVTIVRDGKTLSETTGGKVAGGQWENLKTLINQLVDQGRILREGDLILSGNFGQAPPAESGKYTADYGPLGVVEVQME